VVGALLLSHWASHSNDPHQQTGTPGPYLTWPNSWPTSWHSMGQISPQNHQSEALPLPQPQQLLFEGATPPSLKGLLLLMAHLQRLQGGAFGS